VRCPKCTAENPAGARFCGVCGARLSDETQTSGHGLHEVHGHHERPPGPNRTPLVVAVAVAVLIAVVAGLLYADVRGDLRAAEEDLEEARTNADELNSILNGTREELRATEDELTESREAFDRSSRCLFRMFDAWYSTLDLSLTATGFALARAVQSEVCQMSRAAYERST
jgi:zinc-ribbon domain